MATPSDSTQPESEKTPEEIYLAALGVRVRNARRMHRWSQSDLSRESGYDVASISKLETGQRAPGPYVLARIAEALAIPLAELLGEAPSSDPRGSLEDLVSLTALASRVRSQAEWQVSLLKSLRAHGIDLDDLPPPPGD